MEPVLRIQGLHVWSEAATILERIDLTLEEGELICIVGPSGSGKSTLLRTINGLAQESGLRVRGSILYWGWPISRYPLHELRQRVGMVFQKPCMFPGSILRNVLFGVRHHRRLSRGEARILAETVLRKAHLWEEVKDRLDRPARELSLGQQQRLCLARVLAVGPEVLLLDEPTSSLDPHSTHEIERTLEELKTCTAILLVTHHLDQAQRLADRSLSLESLNSWVPVLD